MEAEIQRATLVEPEMDKVGAKRKQTDAEDAAACMVTSQRPRAEGKPQEESTSGREVTVQTEMEAERFLGRKVAGGGTVQRWRHCPRAGWCFWISDNTGAGQELTFAEMNLKLGEAEAETVDAIDSLASASDRLDSLASLSQLETKPTSAAEDAVASLLQAATALPNLGRGRKETQASPSRWKGRRPRSRLSPTSSHSDRDTAACLLSLCHSAAREAEKAAQMPAEMDVSDSETTVDTSEQPASPSGSGSGSGAQSRDAPAPAEVAGTAPAPVEEEVETKRKQERRKEDNRKSAQRTRERQDAYVKWLEGKLLVWGIRSQGWRGHASAQRIVTAARPSQKMTPEQRVQNNRLAARASKMRMWAYILKLEEQLLALGADLEVERLKELGPDAVRIGRRPDSAEVKAVVQGHMVPKLQRVSDGSTVTPDSPFLPPAPHPAAPSRPAPSVSGNSSGSAEPKPGATAGEQDSAGDVAGGAAASAHPPAAPGKPATSGFSAYLPAAARMAPPEAPASSASASAPSRSRSSSMDGAASPVQPPPFPAPGWGYAWPHMPPYAGVPPPAAAMAPSWHEYLAQMAHLGGALSFASQDPASPSAPSAPPASAVPAAASAALPAASTTTDALPLPSAAGPPAREQPTGEMQAGWASWAPGSWPADFNQQMAAAAAAAPPPGLSQWQMPPMPHNYWGWTAGAPLPPTPWWSPPAPETKAGPPGKDIVEEKPKVGKTISAASDLRLLEPLDKLKSRPPTAAGKYNDYTHVPAASAQTLAT